MSFYETSDNNGNIYFDLMRKDTRYVINPASKAVIFEQTYNLVDNHNNNNGIRWKNRKPGQINRQGNVDQQPNN